MAIHVVEVSRVIPSADSDSVLNSANSLAIPLTFFDLPWLLFHPSKRVLFYRLSESTREQFHSFIVPKLKLSLSLALHNYLPLSGRLTWDLSEPKPSIVVSPNDAVSLTIAESEADFSLLSGYGQRPVSELLILVPELPVSNDSASVFSLQITLFPNHGFSIGYAAHHAVLDGKTTMMFINAWAHLCKQHLQENRVNSLPENLTPSLDRSLIADLPGLDEKMIEVVRALRRGKITNMRSPSPILISLKDELIGLRLKWQASDKPRTEWRRIETEAQFRAYQIPAEELGDDIVLSTLVLSRDDVEKLRERVKSESTSRDQRLHLSTFVIAYAYVWNCLVKARGGNVERSVSFVFVGDFRERLDPPLPATYFGNCVFPAGSYNRKAADFAEERGFVTAVEVLSELVKGLSSRKIETIAEEFKISFGWLGVSSQFGSVAGSTGLGVYESDFGWGRPVKSDVLSITGEGISMAEGQDQSGGIEIGMCLKKTEMDIVLTLFNNGLQN